MKVKIEKIPENNLDTFSADEIISLVIEGKNLEEIMAKLKEAVLKINPDIPIRDPEDEIKVGGTLSGDD